MRLLRWVLGFLAVSVLALALVVVFRTSIAERLAPVIADDLGIPLNAITVSEIGLDRVVVRDVALGRDRVLRIGQATLEFDALEGTATLASIQDVRLRLEPFGDGPPLGSLQPLIAGGGSRRGSTRLPALPPIRFDRVSIEIATPLGPVSVRLDGTARLGPGGLNVRSALRFGGLGGDAAGRIAITGPSLDSLTTRLILERGRADAAGVRLEGFSGEATLSISAGKPVRLRARFGAREVAGGGVSPGSARIVVDASPESVALDIAIGDAANGLAAAAELRLDGLATAKPRASVSAKGSFRSSHKLIAARADALGLSGAGTIEIRGEGHGAPLASLPSDLAEGLAWLASARFRATADIGLAVVAYRDRVAGARIVLPLSVDVAPNSITLGLARDATMTAARLMPFGKAVPKAIAPALARFSEDVRLTIPAGGDAPFRARLEGGRLAASLGASLTGAKKSAVTASASLSLDFDEAYQPVSWSVPSWSVAARNLPLRDAAVSRLDLSGQAEGAGDGATGRALGKISIARLASGGAECRAVAATLDIEAAVSAATIEAKLAAPGMVRARRCRFQGGWRTDRAIRVRIPSGKVTASRKADGAIDYRVRIVPRLLGLRSQNGPVRHLRARIGSVRASGRIEAGGNHRARVALRGLRIEAVDRKLAIEDATADLRLGGAGADLAARFEIGAVRHLALPPLASPVAVAGTLRRRRGRIAADATLKGAGGLLDARILVSHILSKGTGSARIEVAPMVFGAGAGAPRALSGRLAGIKDMKGEIRLGATVRWNPDGLDGEAGVSLNEVSFRTDDLEIVGLSGEIKLADLQPPLSAGVQTLSARRIVAGVPFENVAIRFALPRDAPGKLRIAGARARFADGRFTLGETLLDPAAESHDLRLGIAGLDLAIVSALAGVDGIKATGRLSGEIPITLADGGFMISGGRLASEGKGRLSIKSAAAKAALQGGGAPVALILAAIEDFRYRALSLAIDKPAAGKSRIRLKLEGSNPAVLDGHPFAFNIGLKGDVDKVLKLFRRGTGLASEILRRRRSGQP